LTNPEERRGKVLNGIRLPGSAGKPEVQENRRFRLLKLFTGCRLRLPQYKTFRKSKTEIAAITRQDCVYNSDGRQPDRDPVKTNEAKYHERENEK